MNGKRVRWSNRAKLEFADIKTYFDKRNGSSEYGKKLFHKITDTLKRIVQHEMLGEKSPRGDFRFAVVEKLPKFLSGKSENDYRRIRLGRRRDPEELRF